MRLASRNGVEFGEFMARIPLDVHLQVRSNARNNNQTMAAYWESAVDQFLQDHPWDLPFFKWKRSKSAIERASLTEKDPALIWKQFCVRLSPELSEQVEKITKQEEVSYSSFLYTVIYWKLGKESGKETGK